MWQKLEKGTFATETDDKPTLQRLPLDLNLTFVHKLATAE